MLHRFLIFFSIAILISACYGNKKPKKPENLISKKDMVNILIDIRIMASASGKNRQKLDELGIHQDDYIYKKHNIDSLQFALSNNYYAFLAKAATYSKEDLIYAKRTMNTPMKNPKS